MSSSAKPAATAWRSTGATTVAELVPRAAELHSGAAQRYRRGEHWVEVSYAELLYSVREVALGLIRHGIEPGDKVAILSNTRPEWTWADLGSICAGATVVPIYQTNSPEECEYVLSHSEARLVFCEDRSQLDKIAAVRGSCPALEHVVAFEGEGAGAVPLRDFRGRAQGADPEAFEARVAAVDPAEVCTYIYTSGTTGPPKACMLTHANYRANMDQLEQAMDLGDGPIVQYVFLPLAHALTRMIQFISIDLGATLAYWGGDSQRIVPELAEVAPTHFVAVPRLFEKIYTLARSGGKDPQELGEGLRGLFGGAIRQAITGSAPIAVEILEFFWACGVPVYEGYGMTETSAAATINTPEHTRLGTVGRTLPGVELEIAADGEVLMRGENMFKGYYKNEQATDETLEGGWLHSGDLGALDDEGYLTITGRKKDLIITSSGKNITPTNIENSLKQSRWISEAVVYGDRRPYLVALITLDPDELPALAERAGVEPDLAEMARDERVRAVIGEVVDGVNQNFARIEQVKRFALLDHELSQEGGELTPSLKVKRRVVYDRYASVFDALYEG